MALANVAVPEMPASVHVDCNCHTLGIILLAMGSCIPLGGSGSYRRTMDSNKKIAKKEKKIILFTKKAATFAW